MWETLRRIWNWDYGGFRAFLGRGSQSKGSKPEDMSESQEHFAAAHSGQEDYLPVPPLC